MTMGTGSDRSAQRIGYEDREAAADRLRRAAGDGRLALDELDSRLEQLFAAQTFGQLEALTADLPPLTNSLAADTARQYARFAVTGGHIDRIGSWIVPARIDLILEHATSILDFRTSALPDTGVDLHIAARNSSIRLLAGPRTHIDLDNLGRHRARVSDRRAPKTPISPMTPYLRVTGDIRDGSVKVRRSSRGGPS